MIGTSVEPGFLKRLESLEGKKALILGGHGELAHAIAAGLADRGASLVLAARKLDKCQELAREIQAAFGVSAFALQCDLSQEASVVSAVSESITKLGGLDILVNNAGASWSAPAEDMPSAGWQKVIDVNLTGAFFAAREAGRHMLTLGKGSIIFIASTGAFTSFTPDLAQIVPYTTSKAGVVHLTRDLAAQWANRGVRVNAVAPGQIRSGMTLTIPEDRVDIMRASIPMKRLGEPSEFAAAAAYLASDASSYMTGQTIIIDGGLTLT
jgi:gluconate 5-dehydrogenase